GDVPVSRARACGFGVIATIAPSPVEKDLVWVGTDDGLIHVTRDGGKKWQNVTPRGLAEWSRVAQIDASATSAGTAYAAVDRRRHPVPAGHRLPGGRQPEPRHAAADRRATGVQPAGQRDPRLLPAGDAGRGHPGDRRRQGAGGARLPQRRDARAAGGGAILPR